MGDTSKHANPNVCIDMFRSRNGVTTTNNQLICCTFYPHSSAEWQAKGSSECHTNCFCGRWSGPDSDGGGPKEWGSNPKRPQSMAPQRGIFGKIGEKYGGNILEIWSFSGIRYLRSDETSSREGTAWENMLTEWRSRDWGVSRDLLDSNLDRACPLLMRTNHTLGYYDWACFLQMHCHNWASWLASTSNTMKLTSL